MLNDVEKVVFFSFHFLNWKNIFIFFTTLFFKLKKIIAPTRPPPPKLDCKVAIEI
jgi:hypothetical protein